MVQLQIRVAEGHSLRDLLGEIPRVGHAIECRLYCEDPTNNFLPSVGRLDIFEPDTIEV